MRITFACLVLLAALTGARAQEATPADASLNVCPVYPGGEDIRLTGENAPALLNWTALPSGLALEGNDPALNVSLTMAGGAEPQLTDEARLLLDDLNAVPADRPRSVALCLNRLQRLQDAYTRLDYLDEAAAIREVIKTYRARQTQNKEAGRSAAASGNRAIKNRPSQTVAEAPLLAFIVDSAQELGNTAFMVDGNRAANLYRSLAIAAQFSAPPTPDALFLPQAAKELLAQMAKDKEIPGREAQIRSGLNTLRGMETAYAQTLQLDVALSLRDARLRFVGDGLGARPDSGPLTGYRGSVGQSFYFYAQGHAPGSVWGDGVYTDDSALGVVAVHAGLLRVAQKGLIKVTFLPGRESYDGSTRHGVSSQTYAAWQGSYRVESIPF